DGLETSAGRRLENLAPDLEQHQARRLGNESLHEPHASKKTRTLFFLIAFRYNTRTLLLEMAMDALWRDLLHPDVSILEKVIRPILVYFFLVISLRLAGKRELAQLNAFDLVVLLTLSNTVQNAIIGSDNSVTGGIIGATTLLAVNYIVVRFLYSHQTLDKLIEGDSQLLIETGCLCE